MKLKHLALLLIIILGVFLLIIHREKLLAQKKPAVNQESIITKATTRSAVPTSQRATTPTNQDGEDEKIFKLDVPFFHQQYENSCEASSLRMALGYYGIETDDMTLVNTFGYRPRDKNVEKNIWDDPQKMFVGYVDIAGSTKGYGVYGLPVARAAETFGRNAVYKTTITPQELAMEIYADHPVIMWGYTSLTQPPYTWNVTDESGAITNTVKAFHGEHVRLVVGVYGPVEHPIGFYVHDPLGHAFTYWSSEKLMGQFNSVYGVTNQVVIVK